MHKLLLTALIFVGQLKLSDKIRLTFQHFYNERLDLYNFVAQINTDYGVKDGGED